MLSVQCSFPRAEHERLNAVVESVASSSARQGHECLLVAVEELRDAVQSLQHSPAATHAKGTRHPADCNSETPRAADADAPGRGSSIGAGLASGDAGHADDAPAPASATPTSPPAAPAAALLRVLVWFHHIKNTSKKKQLLQWAGELAVSGYCKPGVTSAQLMKHSLSMSPSTFDALLHAPCVPAPAPCNAGFPGVLVVEGEEGAVQEYVQRVRSLGWQAMQVCTIPTGRRLKQKPLDEF